MTDRKEQRVCLKFCFLLKKTAVQAHEMLTEAYTDDVMSRTQVYEWYHRFKRGQMSVDDEPRAGRPSTSHTNENVEKIRENE